MRARFAHPPPRPRLRSSLGFYAQQPPSRREWYARLYLNGRYKVSRLGNADDLVRTDGISILSYDQAVEGALSWFEAASVSEFGYTVQKAVEDYRDYLHSERKPSAKNVGWLLKSHLRREGRPKVEARCLWQTSK